MGNIIKPWEYGQWFRIRCESYGLVREFRGNQQKHDGFIICRIKIAIRGGYMGMDQYLLIPFLVG